MPDFDNVLVVDVESSGIDPLEHGLLSIGAVWLTDLTQTFYVECKLDDFRLINEKALGINGFTKEQCADSTKITEHAAVQALITWSALRGIPLDKIIIAGENPHFDRMFVQLRLNTSGDIHGDYCVSKTTTNWADWPFSRGMLDLHTVAFSRYFTRLRHSEICKALLLPPEDCPHNALKGAMSEALCFRKFFGIDTVTNHEKSELWTDWDAKK